MRITPSITHLIMKIVVVPLNMEDTLPMYADVFQIIIPHHNPFFSEKSLYKDNSVVSVSDYSSRAKCVVIPLILCFSLCMQSFLLFGKCVV